MHNQRVQIAARALELSNEQDRRQADYLAEELASRERADIRRHSVATRTLFGSFAFSAIILGLLIGLAFFGSPEQSKTAIEVLRIAGTGLGGFGIVYALLSVLRWLRR